MTTEVRLPQFGMGMQDGVIIEWLKREGEPVLEGEVLVEVEASKAVMEVVAPASGTLVKILARKEQTVPVREVIAIIAAPGESWIPDETGEPAWLVASVVVSAAVSAETAGISPRAAQPGERAGAGLKVQIEPRARRLAQEHGIGLEKIPGSGPGGRITEDDVRRVLSERGVQRS